MVHNKTYNISDWQIVQLADDDVNDDSNIVVVEQYGNHFVTEHFIEKLQHWIGHRLVFLKSYIGAAGQYYILFPVEVWNQIFHQMAGVGSFA